MLTRSPWRMLASTSSMVRPGRMTLTSIVNSPEWMTPRMSKLTRETSLSVGRRRSISARTRPAADPCAAPPAADAPWLCRVDISLSSASRT